MTDNLKRKPSLPSCRETYDVGYGKPPVDGRFKKGQSGNPKGRPKGSKNAEPAWNEERLKNIVLQEAYRTITVQDGDRNVTVPMAQASVCKAIYMPSIVATRFNSDMKVKYEQLISNGKYKKQAFTAVMRKPVVLANARLGDGRKWNEIAA